MWSDEIVGRVDEKLRSDRLLDCHPPYSSPDPASSGRFLFSDPKQWLDVVTTIVKTTRNSTGFNYQTKNFYAEIEKLTNGLTKSL